MSHTTVCPKCHVKSKVDESLIGRFITCEQCRCLYYVVVPPLGEERSEWHSVPATSPAIAGESGSPPRSSSTALESLRGRVQILTVLVVLNLVIGSLALVMQLFAAKKQRVQSDSPAGEASSAQPIATGKPGPGLALARGGVASRRRRSTGRTFGRPLRSGRPS